MQISLKKISLIFLLIMIVGLGIFFYIKNTYKDSAQILESQTKNIPDDQTLSEDSDHDGLKNWEEVLWKTDIHNPDTDGDGMKDREEVSGGRDPVVSGVGERNIAVLYQTKTEQEKEVAKTSPQNTDTPATKPPPEKPTTVVSPLKKYGNDLAKILKQKGLDYPNQLQVFQTLITTPTPETYTSLHTISQSFATLARDIEILETPESVQILAKKLVSNYTALSVSIETIASKGDGTPDTNALTLYNDTNTTVGNSLVELASFFKQNNIIWGANEDGYMFTQLN